MKSKCCCALIGDFNGVPSKGLRYLAYSRLLYQCKHRWCDRTTHVIYDSMVLLILFIRCVICNDSRFLGER